MNSFPNKLKNYLTFFGDYFDVYSKVQDQNIL